MKRTQADVTASWCLSLALAALAACPSPNSDDARAEEWLADAGVETSPDDGGDANGDSDGDGDSDGGATFLDGGSPQADAGVDYDGGQPTLAVEPGTVFFTGLGLSDDSSDEFAAVTFTFDAGGESQNVNGIAVKGLDGYYSVAPLLPSSGQPFVGMVQVATSIPTSTSTIEIEIMPLIGNTDPEGPAGALLVSMLEDAIAGVGSETGDSHSSRAIESLQSMRNLVVQVADEGEVVSGYVYDDPVRFDATQIWKLEQYFRNYDASFEMIGAEGEWDILCLSR